MTTPLDSQSAGRPRVDPPGAADPARRTELIGGLLLLGAAALAMLVANSSWSSIYDRLLDLELEIRLGEASLAKPLLLWINDGLMAVFFLLVGLELKLELLDGHLSKPGNVVMPLAAAAGGVVLPIGIYLACTAGDPLGARGWAIPAATDIAFAVGMLALLGDRVPASLRTFLLTLAVFDDVAAIVIIAISYTDRIDWSAKGMALGVLAVLLVMNRLRVTRYGVYLLVGSIMWLCVVQSGVHATLAGVALAFTIPRSPRNTLGHRPLKQLEHALRPWVTFLILPLFAFVNAGVTLRGLGFDALTNPVTLGTGLGLVVGKIVGVFGASMLVVRFGLGRLPDGSRPVHYFGVAALAGIGFTMSLFIGVLAFEDLPRGFDVPIRIGVLGGSLVASVIGLSVLRSTLRRP